MLTHELTKDADIRPTFVAEFDKTLAYIEVKSENPQAADRLLNDVYAARQKMLIL